MYQEDSKIEMIKPMSVPRTLGELIVDNISINSIIKKPAFVTAKGIISAF
jgi:hypothetical protein